MAGFRSPLGIPLGIAVDQTVAPTVGFTSLFWWMGGLSSVATPAESTSTSAGTYNMYRPWDWGKKRKLRKIKYLGPANEKLTFYVESTPANKWIPTTIYKPSVLDEIERNGLIIRQINGEKLRQMIMADDEWFMLN